MWANWIETGRLTISAEDAKNAKQPYYALSEEQMKLVIELRELATEINNLSRNEQ